MNGKKIFIRKATVSDYIPIAYIVRNSLGYDCSDELVKFRLENIDSEREVVFIAANNKEVIGFVHGERFETLYFDTLVNILGLAVKTEHQHNGVGRQLMNYIEIWAKDIGANGIRLNSGSTRKNAHEFYRAIGFNNEKLQIRFMRKL